MLRVAFGPDAQIFIKSFKSHDRHAIITFDSAAKASQFVGKIPVKGQFVNVILLDQNSPASANPPPVPANPPPVPANPPPVPANPPPVPANPPPVPANPPPVPPEPPKEIKFIIKFTYPRYRYIVDNRPRINHLCQNVKTTFDDEHYMIKLNGPQEPMRKAIDALKKFQDNISQETISDVMFNWFAAKLLLRYHLDKIAVQWSVALFLYRDGDEKPVKALTNYKNATDADARYHVIVVGYINKPGMNEAAKCIRALQLREPEVLNITPQNQVALFKQEPGKNGTNIVSISKEHHCYIDVFNNKARIYAFKEKEMEGARKALEEFLVTTDKIQIDPAKNEYLRRYKTAELEAIRRKHHAVRITGTFSDNIQSNKVDASRSSVTSPKRGFILLEGPPAYVTKARVDVMELVGQIIVKTLNVNYPLRHQSMALRRFNSQAREIQSHHDIVLDISSKILAKDNDTLAKDIDIAIHIVACGEAGVVKESLDKFPAINFLVKDIYKISGEQNIPSGRQLEKLKNTTLEDFNVLLHFRLNDRAIDMNAEDPGHIASARANIDAFLKGENASEIFIIPNLRNRSWFEKYKDEKKLYEIGKEHQVWIKPEKKDGQVHYKISGPQKNIEGALAAFKAYTTKLTSPLQTMAYKIERQKAEIILSERRRVRQIESKYQADILFPKREFHVTIRSTNQVIEATLGDIALEKVDAIVNASNSRLDHSAGMAKTIADAAGQQFIDDCRNYITQYGTIPTGQAIGTSAGDLQKNGVKFVIHAVGPVWKSGTNNEKEYLFAAISNALTYANTKGCKTVALPPVSTGIYGFPHDKAAKIIVDAVVNTLPKTKLHKVRIIDFQPNSMLGPQEEEGEDGDVEDVDPVNSTSLYAMIRSELKDRRKALESDDDRKSDLSVLSLPKFQALPYQWFWKEDTGGKHYKGQPWIMYDRDQSVEIEEAWKKWKQYDSQNAVNVSPLNIQNVYSMNASSLNTLNTQKSQAGIFDWLWQTEKGKNPLQAPSTSILTSNPPPLPPKPPQSLPPPPQPLKIVGDVGGVKAGVMYEILFSADGEHKQRNCNTGHKRPIMRKDIDITAAAKTSTSQVSNLPDANKPSLVDYKYWKEKLEFTITGNMAEIPTVIKELEALAVDYSEAIHMVGKWGLIGKADREAAVREIAGRLYVDAEIQPDGQVIKLTGQESSIRTVRAEIYKWAFEKSSNIEQEIPPNWTSFDESMNCILVTLQKDEQEWTSVTSRIIQTMPNAKIKKIERVQVTIHIFYGDQDIRYINKHILIISPGTQNRHLWATFQHNHRHISKKNSGNVNTLHLFHGSRGAKPSSIYQGEEGFDPRFSALGMWGKGCYFAVNASYSSNYAYVKETSRYKQFFLAEVITGDSILLLPDSNLVMPPLKPKQNGQFVNERYDSVKDGVSGPTTKHVFTSTT
ncbi:hypothetical protein BC937DRAFT_89291 [Endogone sp. FLAS-F59071]|nr:hypothetical protein BC937DRAFT_89291 [Endogone sp. FLAS-F59071]|eukprot:RUS17975.1 hypothetical protein BC937DRAFT_89291 [Endogone sp. FLAS-F59071]